MHRLEHGNSPSMKFLIPLFHLHYVLKILNHGSFILSQKIILVNLLFFLMFVDFALRIIVLLKFRLNFCDSLLEKIRLIINVIYFPTRRWVFSLWCLLNQKTCLLNPLLSRRIYITLNKLWLHPKVRLIC